MFRLEWKEKIAEQIYLIETIRNLQVCYIIPSRILMETFHGCRMCAEKRKISSHSYIVVVQAVSGEAVLTLIKAIFVAYSVHASLLHSHLGRGNRSLTICIH